MQNINTKFTFFTFILVTITACGGNTGNGGEDGNTADGGSNSNGHPTTTSVCKRPMDCLLPSMY